MSHQENSASSMDFDNTKLADFDISPQKWSCVSNGNESESNYPCDEAITFNKLEEPGTSIQHVDERMVASPGTHVNSQRLVCPMCSKSFAWKNSLVKHLKIHSGEKSFACGICGRPFTRKDDLKRHLGIHSQEKYFKCDVCDKSFQRKYFDTHMLKHREKKFNCEICNKTFTWDKYLKRHLKIHSPEKFFKCEICSKTFTRNDVLKRHERIHSQEKYFKCEICDRSFQRQHYFTMHMLKHNSGEFNCKLCDRSFASVKTKQQHVRESHSASALTKAVGVLPTALESLKRVKREERALNTFANVYFEPLEEMKGDFIRFFEEVAPHLQSKLNEELHAMRAIKWYGVVKATLVRFSENGEEEHATPYFRSDVLLELVSDTIESHIQEAFAKIRVAFDEFVQRGSGWTLEKIEHFELSMAKYQPLR